jgi:hypothetical protein
MVMVPSVLQLTFIRDNFRLGSAYRGDHHGSSFSRGSIDRASVGSQTQLPSQGTESDAFIVNDFVGMVWDGTGEDAKASPSLKARHTSSEAS